MRSALLALPPVLLLGLGLGHPDGPDPDTAQVDRGRQIFETVCSVCHTVNPPPDSAPPMAHVVRHLRMELGSREAFAEHVRTYVAAPDPERSLLPAMAIERFGLMGALPLGDSILTDVAAYIWTLADSAQTGSGMGRGPGMGGGGVMPRRGVSSDTAGTAGAGGMMHRHRAQGGGGGMMHRRGAPADTTGTAGGGGMGGGGMCRMGGASPPASPSGGPPLAEPPGR